MRLRVACFLLTSRCQIHLSFRAANCHVEEYEMKCTTILFLALAAAAFAGPANAIFKCTTPKGVVYQDRPCRDGNESDVTIVIPTGEMAPRAAGTTDDSASPNNSRADDKATPARTQRNSGDRSEPATKPVERKNADSTASNSDTTQRRSPPPVEKTVPISTDEARKTDPSAKYYATEGFGTGADTPSQMNCESPTGEKRVFYLSNGKLTSI
jgi:hypothetical protein